MKDEDLLNALKNARDYMRKAPVFEPVIQVHSFYGWKILREGGWCFAQWTDKELENYNKDSGLIGTKCGIDCYVTKTWQEIL